MNSLFIQIRDIKFTFLLCLLLPFISFSQDLPISKNFAQAIENKTRTFTGNPGPNYFQNRVSYNITAEINPGEKKLFGSETIIFENNSPDTLNQILMHVHQNLYKKGTPKDDYIHPDDIHSGVEIESVNIKEKQIAKLKSEITLLNVLLKEYVYPSEKITIEVKWNLTIPTKSNIRMGGKDSTSFFLGHWFPRIAVYDDLKGWDKDIHSGDEEFYYDMGDFEYSVKVPAGFMVWGTGLLQNAEELLSKSVYKKYKQAKTGNTVISIIGENEFNANADLTKGNRWKFIAKNVSDVAFGISDHFYWDATSTEIAEKRVFVEAAYPPESEDFKEVAYLAKKSIEYFTTELPGVPYPFPAVSVFNGQNGSSGMEYPMIANNPSADNRGRTVDVTAHEIAHNYFPFYVLSNETEHAWMDEAFAVILHYEYQLETEPTLNRLTRYTGYMNKHANTDRNIATITNSTFIKANISSYNFYSKPAVGLYVLQDMLGKDLFKKCMIKYIEVWKGKHPAPEDFFFLVNETAQWNLNWFWKSWFYGNGYPDLSIDKVEKLENSYEVTIKKLGNLPIPILLKANFKNDKPIIIKHSADVWDQSDVKIIKFETNDKIESLILGNEYIPDTNPQNNYYEIK